NFLGLATRAPSNPDALSYPGFKVDMYQELGVDVVRFPGGEVSNNYMWDYYQGNAVSSSLGIDISAEPVSGGSPIYDNERYSAGIRCNSSGNCGEDFRDQLVQMDEIQGIESNFVLNVESAFLECDSDPTCTTPDLEKWAGYAAAWVEAVRAEGYFVRYWEIGNEPYLGGSVDNPSSVKRNLTADEYADAYLAFTSAMKAVDPTIHVGAVGDWDWKYRSPADLHVYSEAEAPQWWPRILERICTPAGGDLCPQVDFATFHHYNREYVQRRETPSSCQADSDCPLGDQCYKNECRYLDLLHKNQLDRMRNRVDELLRELDEHIRPDVPVFATEFNVFNKIGRALSFQEHLLYVTEIVGNFAEAGVNNIQWWPISGGPGGFNGNPFTAAFQLTWASEDENYPAYELFQHWSEYIHGVVVPITAPGSSEKPDGHVFAFGSCAYNPNVLSIFVTNKNDEPRNVTFTGLAPTRFDLIELAASDQKPKTRDAMLEGTTVTDRRDQIRQTWNSVSFTMPPKSLFILSSKNDGRGRLLDSDQVGIFDPNTREFFLDTYGDGKWNSRDVVTSFGGRNGDQPVVGDFNGDGRSNLGLFRPNNSSFSLQRDYDTTWDSGEERYGVFLPDPGPTVGIVGRWHNSPEDRVGLYYPDGEQFALDRNGSMTWSPKADRRLGVAQVSGHPVVGDWDCNRENGDEFAILSPDGAFHLFAQPTSVRPNRDTAGTPIGTIVFLGSQSESEDVPLIGDWNGDGCESAGVYRPSEKLFVLDFDGDGVFEFDDDWVRRFAPDGIPIAGNW
ncbi:MAG: hypothetical protein AAF654_14630, partial [Myxococcota bacterium]